jgi:hypothetical protein
MTQKTRRGSSTRKGARAGCLTATTALFNSTVHPHGAPPAADSAVATAADWIRSSHRLLRMRGLSSGEAGNVVAYVAGLHAADDGWSVRQIEQLVALRTLVACRVIAS